VCSASRPPPPRYLQEISLCDPLYEWLGGPQGRSRRYSLWGIEPQLLKLPARSLIAISKGLSRLNLERLRTR
jgi:hypothetical protein